MDLDILFGRTRGRQGSPVQAEIVRELTEVDLALLELDRGIKAPTLKKLRDSHHSIARLMAQGLRNSDIAAVTGYSQSRLSIFKADPAFQELMAFYKEQVEDTKEAAYAGAQEKLAAVNHDAIEELHERLLDTPEAVSTDQLMDIVKLASDRTGHGPQSKSTQVNVNIDLAGRVQAGRARANAIGLSPASTTTIAQGEPPMKVVEGSVSVPEQAGPEPSSPKAEL